MKVLLTIVLLVSCVPAFSQTLTLKEKKAVNELDFGWAERRIAESYGTPVTIVLDEPSFAGELDAILYADARGAQVAANAIARICGDALGKDALQKQKLTKVVIRHLREGKRSAEIKGGVLTVSSGLSSDENYFSDSELRDVIENTL